MHDAPTGCKTVRSIEEEAIVVAFRKNNLVSCKFIENLGALAR